MPLSEDDAAFMLAIGKQIRILRLTREWTQAELAYFSGLSRAFLALMERGGLRPPEVGHKRWSMSGWLPASW